MEEKTNKRYYWLKLKEDFFTDKKIKRLRRISGGDTYTVIYLKLLLLSLKDNGKLFYDGVETDFIKELALTIDETEDDVLVTTNYLLSQNLMEVVNENDEYFLTKIPSLIGSETEWAKKKREYRKGQMKDNVLKLSENCPTDVRQEIEIEKDIEIELEKEREGEKENGQSPNPPLPPNDKSNLYGEFKNVSLSDEEYKNLSEKLSIHLNTMIDKLSRYIESTGKAYKSHYATLLTWYEEDKEKLNKQNKAKAEYNPQAYSDISL